MADDATRNVAEIAQNGTLTRNVRLQLQPQAETLDHRAASHRRFRSAFEDANFPLKFVPRRSNENVSGLINLDDNAVIFVSRCVHLGTWRDTNEMKGAEFSACFTRQQFGAVGVA